MRSVEMLGAVGEDWGAGPDAVKGVKKNSVAGARVRRRRYPASINRELSCFAAGRGGRIRLIRPVAGCFQVSMST